MPTIHIVGNRNLVDINRLPTQNESDVLQIPGAQQQMISNFPPNRTPDYSDDTGLAMQRIKGIQALVGRRRSNRLNSLDQQSLGNQTADNLDTASVNTKLKRMDTPSMKASHRGKESSSLPPPSFRDIVNLLKSQLAKHQAQYQQQVAQQQSQHVVLIEKLQSQTGTNKEQFAQLQQNYNTYPKKTVQLLMQSITLNRGSSMTVG